MKWIRFILPAWLAWAGVCDAQVPTATGTTIAMSNAAWSLFIPSEYVSRGSVADIVYHFHGDPATFRNNAKYAKLNAVILTINYNGLSSAYQTPFTSDPNLFATIRTEALTKLRACADFPDDLTFDKEAVSSFSAGYGAVRQILKSQTYYNQIDMMLAADTIYAGFNNYPSDKTLVASQMVDWRRYAVDAKNGSKTFLVAHSQVDPVTYASTGLTANDLMSTVGTAPTSVNFNGLGTLNFYRTAQTGNFKVLGAIGTDGDSHLEHLRYIGEYLKQLPLTKVPNAGDLNFDGKVNFADLLGLAAHYNTTAGMSWLTGDFNKDGATNFSDLLLLAANYGTTATASVDWSMAQLAPEPASASLLVLGGTSLLRRARVSRVASTSSLNQSGQHVLCYARYS
ncbi:MAG: dockerin type I domain-containing protein [Tepidisphaeraceae bacterium]